MKRASILDYAFAIGKVRALEKFFIRQEVFAQALESSLAEALRLFVESGLYSEELLHVENSQKLEAVLNQEQARLKQLISDLLLDKELICILDADNLAKMQKVCQQFPGEFLKDYLAHWLDLHNIKTFLRLYFLAEPPEKLEAQLAQEGFINKKVFLECYNQDLSMFLQRLEFVHKASQIISYAYFLQEPIQKIKEGNSFIALEKAINDFLIQFLKSAKYISLGPEPLWAYYFAKLNEMNLMRMIILSKLHDFAQDLAKERLSIVYA